MGTPIRAAAGHGTETDAQAAPVNFVAPAKPDRFRSCDDFPDPSNQRDHARSPSPTTVIAIERHGAPPSESVVAEPSIAGQYVGRAKCSGNGFFQP